VVLIGAPLAFGASEGWPQTTAFLLIGLAAAAWIADALKAGVLTWRRTPVDLPVALLLALVLLQLALGNRALVAWALAPPAPVTELAARFPAPFLTVGSLTPRHGVVSVLVFAGYAAVYFLVVQTVRTRRHLGRLARTLLLTGAALAFLGIVDYMVGERWLLAWRQHPFGGRLSGTFTNPDHFAAWLAMLMALGLGWVVARSPGRRRSAPSLREWLSVRELREQAARRYVPLLGVVVMGVALVLTLSRGGLVNLVATLLALILMLAAVGRARRSLVLTGLLLVTVVAYGGWIGFGPLLARLSQTPEGSADRFHQYVASLPMLAEFPVLGVGLGRYGDLYMRHQPPTHLPAQVYYPYAHNDLLQLAIELGAVGAALCLFLGWRVVGDLVCAHLLGRGACPVDGGEGEEAIRNDPYSLGVAVGALAGFAGLLAHSALDFSARIPAVGFLAAALLGLATVALHTRLQPGHEQLLSGSATVALPRARATALFVATLLILTAWCGAWLYVQRVTQAEQTLLAAPPDTTTARADAVLALDRHSTDALVVRARARQRAALAAWESPPAPGVDRQRVAHEGLAAARADLRAALAIMPTNPWIHLDLAWVEASDAVVQGPGGRDGLAAALTHGSRAIALGATGPLFYAGMARLAYSEPELGLAAAREAVARDPALLGEMVDLYRPLGLTPEEWVAFVPATAVDRLDLAMALEARRLRADALAVYAGAVALAPAREASLYRWALGEALGRAGAQAEAVATLREAGRADSGNPELERALGAALGRVNDPEALDHLRLATSLMEARATATERRPFPVRGARLSGLVVRLAGDLDDLGRYRRALATYLTERRLWDQALPEWRALAAADPRDAEARFGLGQVREAAGAIDEALEDYRAAVALQPRVARYRKRLAERLWQSDQFFQALNEWRTLKSQAPRDVDVRLALARGLEKIGQPGDAYREYREVLQLQPEQPDADRAVARLEGRRRS
jgi:tetratricopeptide (TPR) repeat protein/O-antigen ligase